MGYEFSMGERITKALPPAQTVAGVNPFKHLIEAELMKTGSTALRAELQGSKDRFRACQRKKRRQKPNPKRLSSNLWLRILHLTTSPRSTSESARFLTARKLKKSRKLLQLTIDIGEKEPRNIFSGIAAYYKPEDLIGRLTVVVANLEPRKMMGSFSQGMLLSASDGADTPSGLYLLEPFRR